MVHELILVAAFALFAFFAWLRITALEETIDAESKKVSYYRARVRELERECEENRLHLWGTGEQLEEAGERNEMLERSCEYLCDQNERLLRQLTEYWTMSN